MKISPRAARLEIQPPDWGFTDFSKITLNAPLYAKSLGNDQEGSRTYFPAFYDPLCPSFMLGVQGKFNFHQLGHGTLVDAWLRMKAMLHTCHEHGLSKGAIIQTFYHGLDNPTQGILDAGWIFLYNTPNEAFKILKDKRNSELATKINFELFNIRKELKETGDGRRDNHASQIYMRTRSMCETSWKPVTSKDISEDITTGNIPDKSVPKT
ncbi:hypothetical protein Tco_1194755 [Tanacetum coccineum]